jgi:acetyl-CoA carboxylase carboxyltransferase component
MSAEERTEKLRQKKRQARQSGGPEKIAARRRQGTMSARERVEFLLDPDTFVESDVFVGGVVTGHGMVAGRDVYVFAQDPQADGAVAGPQYLKKITKVMDLALSNGTPLVGIFDAPAQGAASGLAADSDLLNRAVLASGVVPYVAAVVGPVGGAACLLPTVADLVVMVKGAGRLALGTQTEGAGERSDSSGGARVLSERAGVVHLATDDEQSCLTAVRRLLSYLPQNNLDDAPLSDTVDPVDRMDDDLRSLADSAEARDVRQIIESALDRDSLLELLPEWGKGLVTGFARLGGRSVGVAANQPTEMDGAIDSDVAAKGARFVRLCDCFNLPLITIVDTPGVVEGGEDSQGRILRAVAQFAYAYAEATVPKLTLLVGRALGEGFQIMCPKGNGADFCCAWASAVVGSQSDAVPGVGGSEALYAAARAGHLDDIIEPVTSRPRLVAALEACIYKRESRPAKKHGNIPL